MFAHRGFRLRLTTATIAPNFLNLRAFSVPASRMRNVAIIAHVDHGKTTLVDGLLSQSLATARGAGFLDTNPLESERGITILSKSTSILYTPPGEAEAYHFNIVDTPGHADFGGEVERIMSMVDGVCLLCDATSGPMTGTTFVLSKALARGLRPLVVFNKADRASSRIGTVEGEVFDLFAHLKATDEQMDFPYLYASAKEGWAVRDIKEERRDFSPLFNLILGHVPPPTADPSAPFSMLITQTYNHAHFGKCMLGRVSTGTARVGDVIKSLKEDGSLGEEGRVVKLFQMRGMQEIELEQVYAGDIVAIAGLRSPRVNDTLGSKAITLPIKAIPIDPPSLAINISTNSSPLAGREGKAVPAAQLGAWLVREAENNVSITVKPSPGGDGYEVLGRGELQLGVLVENMRRAGFELSVSPPRVLYKLDRNNPKQVMEPVETVILDIPQDFSGRVIEQLSIRKGSMVSYTPADNGECRVVFQVSTRGLMGYRSQFVNETAGQGTMNSQFEAYVPYQGHIDRTNRGAICAGSEGVATAYAISSIEERGVLYIHPGDAIYAGMVIGENSRETDLEVNPCKQKALTNIRAAGKEDAIRLTPPRLRSLEECIAACRDDEILEVTPKSIRLRKAELDGKIRLKSNKANARKKAPDASELDEYYN